MSTTRAPARKRPAWVAPTLAFLLLVPVGAAVWFAYARWTADPLAEARLAYGQGDYEAVRRVARDRLRARPGDPDARLLLARANARRGDDEAARRVYTAIGPDRLDAEDYYLIGASLMREGRDDLARGAFEAATERDPDHVESLAGMAALSSKYKMHEMAESFAARIAKAPGGRAAGAAILGRARLDLNDAATGAAQLGEALQLDPTVARSGLSPDEAHLLHARALLALGRGDAAESALRAITSPAPDLTWFLGRAALQRGDLGAAADLLARSKSEGSPLASDPMTFEPAPFTGSADCAACHAEIHRDQQSSRHARTFARAPAIPDLPLPDAPLPDPHDATVRHALARKGDDLVVESTIDDQVRRAVVKYMIGSGDKGLTLLGDDEAGVLRELRLSHYPGHGWDRTTGHPESPPTRGDFLGLALAPDEQRRCLGCHTTDAFAAAEGTGPAAVDRAIGCETCHGPAGNHLLAVEHGLNDPAIARPRLATAEQTIALCGRCHKPPNDAPVGDPGDPFAVRFQAATLVRSACSIQSPGTFDCITCHDPHRDAETSPAYYEAICLACHSPPDAKLPPVQTGARLPVDPSTLLEPDRRVPCPVNAATGCISCHMPQASSVMSHSKFADHHIRIHPREAATAD